MNVKEWNNVRQIESRLTRARSGLILTQPFFGSEVMRLKLELDSSIPTAAVNSKRIRFNPDFVEGLTDPELMGVLAHEVLHRAFGHHWRRDSRDPKEWNVACDYAINPILVKAGMTLPDGALLDSEYDSR